MRRPTVHIVGAGFSGLSAAVHLSAASDAQIVVHERGAQAGGRRRSFYDEALGMTIDSGNSFLLPTWRSTLATLDLIGARGQWREEPNADLAFADMATGERWTLKPNAGKIPWWTLASRRRAPRTEPRDYLALRKLRNASADAIVADFAPSGPAAERRWRPFTLAALNIDPSRASARLAGAMYAQTLACGGSGARLMFPVGDFARAFVEPALKYLRRREAMVRFDRNLQALELAGDTIAALDFEQDRIDLSPEDALILAVPPAIASALAPGLTAPNEFTATLTAHYAVQPPAGAPRVQGVLNGPFHWLFCYPDRICASLRDAGSLMEPPREKVAADFWRAAAGLTGLSDALPAWRIIRQKRAAFAATPAQDARRPSCPTRWRNLFLAGAYVQNGLPETLESAVRSGEVAAKTLLGAHRK